MFSHTLLYTLWAKCQRQFRGPEVGAIREWRMHPLSTDKRNESRSPKWSLHSQLLIIGETSTSRVLAGSSSQTRYYITGFWRWNYRQAASN